MLCRRRHNIHLIRNTFRLASKRDWDAIKRGIRPVYTAVNADASAAALGELEAEWGQRYPAIMRLWRNATEEFIPFLDYDVEIRQVICSTNAIWVAERALPPGGQGPRPLPDRAGGAKVPVPGHPVPGPDRDRTHPMGTAVVESARGAVPALLPVRFPVPLAEPGVRLATHRALHGSCRQAWFAFAQGAGIAPR
jgi:Transposase, Mutator family